MQAHKHGIRCSKQGKKHILYMQQAQMQRPFMITGKLQYDLTYLRVQRCVHTLNSPISLAGWLNRVPLTFLTTRTMIWMILCACMITSLQLALAQVASMTGSGSWALWGYMTLAQVYKAIITGLCFTSVFICISNSAPNAKKVSLNSSASHAHTHHAVITWDINQCS